MTRAHRRPAIFLDRDGVINAGTPGYVTTWEEFHFVPGSIEAIATLHQAGHRLFVVTNQSGIGRGLYTREAVEDIHGRMLQAIREAGGDLDGIYVCPHAPGDECDCRKPKPGLLLQASREYGVELDSAYLIGDSPRDLEAGKAVGCRVIHVSDGADDEFEFTEKNAPDIVCQRLLDAVPVILLETEQTAEV